MFAARADQENFVHAQQTIAAAKPMNQGVRGLQGKTPGNKAPKTPFKVPLNDENEAGKTGKGGLKTNGKAFTIGKNTTFATPGPNRTALGVKTTNAKANVFKTPGVQNKDGSATKTLQFQKTGSPRLRRPKVKVLSAEAEVAKADEDDLDIEYMPPASRALPEYPSEDEFGPDKEFPQLRPENLMRGWQEVFMNPVDANGVYQSDRLREEQQAKYQKIQDAKMQKHLDDTFDEIEKDLRADLGLPSIKKQVTTRLGTVRSKDAAYALSNAASRKIGARAASKPPPAAALNVRKSRQLAPTNSSARFANANSASRSTLGYAQGRAVSQKVRQPITSVFRDDSKSQSATTSTIKKAVAEEQYDDGVEHVVAALGQHSLGFEDDGLEELFNPALNLADCDSEDDVFQLPVPE